MQNLVIPILCLLLSMNINSFAQDIVKKPLTEKYSGPVRESNWDALPLNAKKVYKKDDVVTWPVSKVNQVVFLYTKSYRVVESSKGCILNPEKVDVPELNKIRKPDSKIITTVKQDECNFKIELLSFNELDETYKKISQETEK